MKQLIAGTVTIFFSTFCFAEPVINTHTNLWKSIPITVDSEHHTYSASEGYLMPEGNYYYTFSGYRCLKNKLENAGIEPIEYKDNKTQVSIYCYPDQ